MHLHVTYGITVTMVSEQTTELSKRPEVVSSRFRTMEYCLPKTELMEVEVVPLPKVVSS